MRTLWHKVWADLWLNKTRSWLAVASIAAGVFCVGTLFGMIDLQLSRMDEAHRQSSPSQISLLLRSDADRALLTPLSAVPGVTGIEPMTPLSVRFRHPGDSNWQTAHLIIRPDYGAQRFDITRLTAGQWPSVGKIAVENLSAEHADLAIGADLEFETPHGIRMLRIDGIVRHPFVKPPQFGGQVHFFADANDAVLFDSHPDHFRQLLVQTDSPGDPEQTRTIASNLRGILANHGIAVNATLLQDPNQHWGRRFVAGVNGILQVMALAALALASVLVTNTVSAHITQQTHQIGVLKALGGGNLLIARLYFSETLILALMATVLAMPLAAIAAYFSSRHLLSLFNIVYPTFAVSWRALAIMLVAGLLLPLLAALGPILRGAGMNVREAIASYGLGSDFGNSRFDIWLEQLAARRLPTLYAAAFANLVRRKMRLVLTQGVLILAGVTFLVLLSLISSLNLTLDNEMARSQYSVRLSFTRDQATARLQELITAMQPDATMETWQRLPVEVSYQQQPITQKGSLGTQLLALPAKSRLYHPLIESGRWLTADDAGQRVLVISAETAAMNRMTVGDDLNLKLGRQTQSWRIIGTYRWLAGADYTIEPIYIPQESLSPPPDSGSLAFLAANLQDTQQEQEWLQSLQQHLETSGIHLDSYNTTGKFAQRAFTRNQFQPVIGTLFGLASMIIAVGGIGLSGALAIGVLQRHREIGVMRAIGAPSAALFRLFFLEGLLHGLTAWLVSMPVAYLVAKPVADELGKTLFGIQLDYCFAHAGVLYWLIIMLPLTGAASYWPARQATQLTVRESLAE